MTSGGVGIAILLSIAALALAGVYDVAFRIVPNSVCAALAITGCTLRLTDQTLGSGIASGLIVLALSAFCWRRGWLGGGDVKLLGATAILVPPMLVPSYIAAVSLAGGGLALIYLVLERIVPALELRPHASLPRRILAIECRRIRRRLSLPYAAAISAAAILTLVKA